jgi:uncharacterized protein YdaU (DUF1376 family)
MPSKPDIWMPLYIGDYLAATAHLDALESGAYLHLLMHQWKNERLPVDSDGLRRIAKVDKDAWSNAWLLLAPFFDHTKGFPVQLRLEKIREDWKSKQLKAKEKAKIAAEARWHKDAPCTPQAMLTPSPSPIPTPIPTEQTLKPSRAKTTREKPTKTELVKTRHDTFKEKIKQYWEYKNPGVEMPWGPAEGRQLAMWLAESPQTSVEQFAGFLRNRARSEVNHAERPSRWVGNVTSYANGALDTFKQPKNGALNGKQVGRTEKTLSAGAEAARDIIESGANYSTENHRETYGDDVFSSGGGEQKLFPNNVGATIEGEI